MRKKKKEENREYPEKEKLRKKEPQSDARRETSRGAGRVRPSRLETALFLVNTHFVQGYVLREYNWPSPKKRKKK